MSIALQRPTHEGRIATVDASVSGAPFVFQFDLDKPTQRYICETLMAGHCYEAESTRAIMETLKPGDTFFDIGANCGWFSAVVLAMGANVVAFEPDESNLADLAQNAPGARIIDAAVADVAGLSNLYENLDNDGGHALWPCQIHPHNSATRDAGGPRKLVKTVRLDDYADVEPVVIKIDTEGAECNVLLGAEKVLANPKLRLVVCERHEMGLELMGHSVAEVEAIMGRHGFTWEQPESGTISNWIFKR